MFEVGQNPNTFVSGLYAGGDIFENMSLGFGSLNISAALASWNFSGFGPNGDEGRVEMLLNGVVVDTHDFGPIADLGQSFATLSLSTTVIAGNYRLAFDFERQDAANNFTPVDYLDNVAVTGTATITPEPATCLSFCLGGALLWLCFAGGG